MFGSIIFGAFIFGEPSNTGTPIYVYVGNVVLVFSGSADCFVAYWTKQDDGAGIWTKMPTSASIWKKISP